MQDITPIGYTKAMLTNELRKTGTLDPDEEIHQWEMLSNGFLTLHIREVPGEGRR